MPEDSPDDEHFAAALYRVHAYLSTNGTISQELQAGLVLQSPALPSTTFNISTFLTWDGINKKKWQTASKRLGYNKPPRFAQYAIRGSH